MVGNIKLWLEISNYGWKYQIRLEISNMVGNIKLWLEISKWLEILNMKKACNEDNCSKHNTCILNDDPETNITSIVTGRKV